MSEALEESDPSDIASEGCGCLIYVVIFFLASFGALIGFYDLGKTLIGTIVITLVAFIALPLVGIIPIVGQIIYTGVARDIIFWAFGVVHIDPFIKLNVPGWVNFIANWIIDKEELHGTLAGFTFAIGYLGSITVSFTVLAWFLIPLLKRVLNRPTPILGVIVVVLFLIAIGFQVWAISNKPAELKEQPTPTVTQQATAPNQPPPGTPAAWASPGASPYYRYFSETHHNIGGDFKTFWLTNDGLQFFGFPLTEEFQENGQTVQYFERARLEAQPGGIKLGLLGRELTAGQTFAPALPFSNSTQHRYFPETQHSLNFGFYQFWQGHAGLARFGYPLSEEFKMGSITVQYFERARFEFHPELNDPNKQVTLGLLGAEILRARHWIP